MLREWWVAQWKEEMTGIGTVGEVIGGQPIEPHLLEGAEAAGGAGTSAAGAAGQAEGGALAPLSAFSSFDSVLGHLGDLDVHGPELAKLALSAALAANIPVFENLYRAQHQLKAVQGDAEGFRAASLELLSKAIDAAPKLPDGVLDEMRARAKAWEEEGEEGEGEEEVEGEAEDEGEAEEGGTGGGAEGNAGEGEESESESAIAKREAARKGKAKAEDSEEDEEESEAGDVSEDIAESGEDDEWVGGAAEWYWEYSDINFKDKVPIKALGEMSRFFPFFEIPSQAVQMQCNYDKELEKANRGRYNLWAFGVLTHLLPVSIPVPTPYHEVFFSEALVRRALPGLEPGKQSLSLAALAVNEGVPVAEAAVEGVTTT